jgi:hypothetical protein
LKEFKVFGGIDPNHLTELLHSGLRNDSEPETFALHFNANGKVIQIDLASTMSLYQDRTITGMGSQFQL